MTFKTYLRILFILGITEKTIQARAADLSRHYSEGERKNYALVAVSKSHFNGQFQSNTWTQAQVVLDTVARSDTLGDDVTWTSFVSIDMKNLRPQEDLSHEATDLKPYWFSLSTNQYMKLPSLVGVSSGMVGNITDFHTFFMPQAEMFGIKNLKNVGDKFKLNGNRSSWDDNQEYFDTAGCQDVENSFIKLENGEASIMTIYRAPSPQSPCISFVMPSRMNTPIINGSANNFQMVRPSKDVPGYSWQVFWGVERFTTTVTVDELTGALLGATMEENVLTLKTTFCKSRDWKSPDCLDQTFDLVNERQLRVQRIQ